MRGRLREFRRQEYLFVIDGAKALRAGIEAVFGSGQPVGSRPAGEGSGPRDGRDRPDSVQLEVEVRGDGSQRCEEAEGSGGREPASEGDGCRSQPGQGGADYGHTKKRLELVSARRD